MSGPWACDECLRRGWLLGTLAPSIERALGSRPAARARELLGLSSGELAAAVGDPAAAAQLQRVPVPALRAATRRARCWACCRHDGAYPRRLSQLGDQPALLYGRGRPELLAGLGERVAVTLVGSRRPSDYGREVAERLGRELGAAGLIVVSGLAFGVDSCAHEGALHAYGATIAVLGGGPERASPAGTRRLYERIATDGLVLSELPPGTTPRRWSFPARNRIMAALAEMTVVVEARRRSGSLITATMASDLGREVGAVPGRVGGSSSDGTNNLLREGAQVIRGAEDVLDSLLGAGIEATPGVGSASAGSGSGEDPKQGSGPSLEPRLAAVLDLVQAGAAGADAVAGAGGLSPDAAAAALVRLELAGLVRADSMGRYRPVARP